ncbi:MAG: FecR domain-containing protein [Arenicellales bacterium]
MCTTRAALEASAASSEVEVGVTAASVTDAIGKPPVSAARDLETGLDVFFNEKISTDDSGRVQLLFRDGTSLTVGASSQMTIDEYVYDPATGTGDMVVSISKGVFRLVGGKISKNKPIVFNSPSATVSVRGGIATIKETSVGLTAALLYGQSLTVEPNVVGGRATKTSQPGNSISVERGQTEATKQKTNPETLAKDLNSLEQSEDEGPKVDADETPSGSDQQTSSTQPEDSVQEPAPAEGDQANTAPQPESGEKLADEGGAPESGLAQTEPDPNQPPPEDTGPVVREGSPDGLLPGADESTSDPGTEPQRLAPITPGESGEAMADGSMVPPPMPGNPEDLQAGFPASPEELTQPVEIGAPSIPEAGMAANIPVTDPPPGLPPLPPGSEGTVYVAPGTAAPPTGGIPSMPVPPTGLKMEINKFAVDFSKDVAAYVPPVGSPIGGTPTKTSAEPAMAMVDMTKAVDDTAKAPGVRTEDGKSVTAPTSGWEASAAYSFTGASAEEMPTHFEPESKDAKTKASHRCDPVVEYCPTESTDTEKSAPVTGTEETVRIKTATTTCGMAGCRTETKTTPEPSTTAEISTPVAAIKTPVAAIKTPVAAIKTPVAAIKTPVEEEPRLELEPMIELMRSTDPTVIVGAFVSDSRLKLSSRVAQWRSESQLIGDQIPLCKECRFLKWYRKSTSVTGATTFAAEIQHWISGAAATASELSAAAGKTASYSGGLVGGVATGGSIQEKMGSFDTRVRFGISEYQVQNFSASFDGSHYTGTSGLTSNDTLFSVTGHSGAKAMSASGYFFGSPAHGNTPPDIGGHFEVTGHDYHAAGVFAGSQR